MFDEHAAPLGKDDAPELVISSTDAIAKEALRNTSRLIKDGELDEGDTINVESFNRFSGFEQASIIEKLEHTPISVPRGKPHPVGSRDRYALKWLKKQQHFLILAA